MRISDWSSDVCSSDLCGENPGATMSEQSTTTRNYSPARRMARAALQLYRISLGVAGLACLALALAHLSGAPLALPFDSYTWYAIAFIGCMVIGIAMVVGNENGRAHV